MSNNHTANKAYPLLQALLKKNLLSIKQYEDIIQTNPPHLIPYLVTQRHLSSSAITQACAEYYNIPMQPLDAINSAELPIASLETSLMLKHNLLPIQHRANQLIIAISDPANIELLNELQFKNDQVHQATICDHFQLVHLINHIISQQHYLQFCNNPTTSHLDPHDSTTIDLVSTLLNDAVTRRASDIHFEPQAKHYQVRMRIDGLLTTITQLPQQCEPSISTRLKVMANLDIAERNATQDGRFNFTTHHQQTNDCRISCCPSLYGEKIVVRLLNSNLSLLKLEQLGLSKQELATIKTTLNKPQGLVLVTGPTGSGKTQTLYAFLQYLNLIQHNILTIEDPIEIKITGITQVNVNHCKKIDFTTALRSFLRLDPDIIMLGEIRDLDTASMAIRAAQTGHLVLSTLHTNSAAKSIQRLLNMGIAPYNLAHSLKLIIAQRLVRQLCPHCKQTCSVKTASLPIEYQPHIQPEYINSYGAKGCAHCHHGYKNRLAIFEIMPITDQLNQIINQNHTDLETQAIKEGMQTLLLNGIEKVNQGLTSFNELNRII